MYYANLRYTKNGYTFSDWREAELGERGDFQKKVIYRRFGSGDYWVFEERVTDDCRADLIACSVQIEGGGP